MESCQPCEGLLASLEWDRVSLGMETKQRPHGVLSAAEWKPNNGGMES
jgi:hypothetical protein